MPMKISVNNQIENVPDGTLLVDLINKLELINKKGIAVARNQSVVASADWAVTPLCENDKIVIIRAAQGG